MIKRKTKRRSSELAELDRASREIEGRIQELEALLSNVKLIEEMDREQGVVNIGSVVTLLEEGEDEEEE